MDKRVNIFDSPVLLSELTENTTINGNQFGSCTSENEIEAFLESISDQVTYRGFWDN